MLWRDRAFVLYWSARTISLMGTLITAVVLPIMIYRLTESAFQTSLLSTLTAAPYVLFGLFAGALADRVDRRRVMVACDLINTALLASIPLAAALGLLTLPHIYAVALLSATAFVWFDAANFGALPSIVGRGRLVEANSLIWSTNTVVEIVTPSVAGVLAATVGPEFSVSFNALSYALSAVCILLIPRALSMARTDETTRGSVVKQVAGDIREGLVFLWRHPIVRPLTLLGFGNSLTGGAVIGLLVVYGVEGLGLAKDDGRIGLLYTSGALGALLSSLLLPRLVRRFSVSHITLWGLVGTLAMTIGLAVTPVFNIGLGLRLLWSACYTLVVINGISIRQMVTPDHLQSRVNATARMIAWGGSPFGAALGGVLAEALGVRNAFLIMTAGVAFSTLIGWLSPLRQAKVERSV